MAEASYGFIGMTKLVITGLMKHPKESLEKFIP